MSGDAPTSNELLETLRRALGAQYSIERVLGQGGMGSVFLGRDLALDRPVAIKVINADVATNQTLRDRFLLEARTVAKLRHPNVVSVYAAGEAGGVLYFAMEYVHGESLRDLLSRERQLTSERAVRIIREVALALDHAHELGLVHRDVKPENILLDASSGRAMLTDFGVSRAFEQDGGLTQTGMILGSPRYMSPEQASGDRSIDGRSDLYALALVAYEMFAGEPVVQSNTMAGMLVKHLTETPPPLTEKAPSVPAEIADAIHKGLAKDPAERWQRGHELADALGGQASAVAGSVSVAAARGQSSSRRWMAIAAAAGVLIAIAFGVSGWLSSRGGPTGDAYLVTPFEIQSGEPSVTWLREGSVNMLTLTLGQWSDLNVVDYERTLSLLDKAELSDKRLLTLDDAMRMARLANARSVVTGQVQAIGNSIIVIAKQYNVRTGRVESQAQVEDALGADPRPLFDQLAQDLLEVGGGRTSTVQLAQATTSNLEAYRTYLAGVKLLNSWQIPEADSAFDRAIALDSTFALAYHKKSLAQGWTDATGDRSAAARAWELSSRLPPRERSLVEGQYHFVMALQAATRGDTALAREEYIASITAFDDIFARGDTLVPEAWHGRADAYHHRRTNQSTAAELRAWTTESFRGFSRTLAIDSTYQLAYAHLVELLNGAAAGSPILIDGDTAILLDPPTRNALGAARIQELRNDARARGIEVARRWATADQQSTRPFMQLVNSYIAGGKPDSALSTLYEALSRPRSGEGIARLSLVLVQESVGDTAIGATLRETLDRANPDSLRELQADQRFSLLSGLVGVASTVGSMAELDRAVRILERTDSVIPSTTIRTKLITDLYVPALRLAMGEPATPALKRSLLTAMEEFGTIQGGIGDNLRRGSVSALYVSYLATRDTVFLPVLRSWAGVQTTPPEINALLAIQRGDTATAMHTVQSFGPVDSLTGTRFTVGGMRMIARAEALAALGLLRQAIDVYDKVTPDLINREGIAEPGFTLWVRSWLARARLWRQLGERDRSMAAYEEFLRRWKDADGVAAAQVSEARQELAALRDAGR